MINVADVSERLKSLDNGAGVAFIAEYGDHFTNDTKLILSLRHNILSRASKINRRYSIHDADGLENIFFTVKYRWHGSTGKTTNMAAK